MVSVDLELTSDVVGLEGQDARHIGVTSRGDEENAKVAHADIVDEAHEPQSDKTDAAVADDEGSADVPLVTVPRAREHEDRCQDVGRGD